MAFCIVGDVIIVVPFFTCVTQTCLKMVGRPLPSHADAREGGRSIMLAFWRSSEHRQHAQTVLPGDTESVHSPPTGRVKRECVRRHGEELLPRAAPALMPQAGLVRQRRRPVTLGCGEDAPAGC